MNDMLDVLRSNHGFSTLDHWLPIATREQFRPVKATPIHACPDCGASPYGTVGQYVHYSTLMRLRECACGLIWSDAALDPQVIAQHFETTYKDEKYFEQRRARIFSQLSDLVSVHTPLGGSVIDIGGGMGHLMNVTRQRRPDLALTVLDLSEDSVAYCRNHFGIDANAGALGDLGSVRYSTAVLSDVLYYEGDMARAWDVLSRIADTLIIRGPNKLKWIRAASKYGPLQTSIKHFNPEHQFIFSREYIERRLRRVGFASVETIPSAALVKWNSRLVDCYSALAYQLTGAIKSPSMITIARRA